MLSNVFGVENVTERIDFEKKVVVDGNTKRIDVYIPETRVIIEQKSLNVPLNKKIRNSGDIDLTPFEQADRYNSKLIFDERARWIVTCNFAEIWIYDVKLLLFTLAGNSLMEVDSFLVLLARVRWNQILLFIRFILLQQEDFDL